MLTAMFLFYTQENVPEQIMALTNISMVETLSLTVGDVLLLTETVNEVIDGAPITNMVSVHVYGECTGVFASLGWDAGACVLECYKCVWSVCTRCCGFYG